MAKRWRIFSHDAARIAALERSAGIPALLAHLLICRGCDDPSSVRAFLDARLAGLADPEQLPGASAAAERIMAAIAAGRPIVLYGDYDVDGMSGAALLYLCLRMLGAQVSYYVPSRIDEGYGLHCQALQSLAERGAKLVVTIDCGIGCALEAREARRLGLELIITDHHQLPLELPEADVIVHARGGPGSELCGAGVAFKLAWALCQRASNAKRVGEAMSGFLLQAIGLAALGTVADIVPLLEDNRLIVRHGLKSLRQRPTPGMAALLRVTQLDQKPELGAEDIAFSLAPRLNAAGRLGQAVLAIELLTTPSAERAGALAEYLNELNGSRESLERSVYLAANKQAQNEYDPQSDSALVLAGHDWHAGVIGIVASRLAEKFHRPVILVALDPTGSRPGVGSARSAAGLDLHAALCQCSELLITHGGHAAAAGLRIDERQLPAFREHFCEVAAGAISPAARQAELRIDAEIPFSALTLRAVEQLEHLAPFGHSNPRPLLCTTGVLLRRASKPIGGGERRLALRLAQSGVELRTVAFGGADWAGALADAAPGEIAIAFRPMINHYRGRRSVELHVCDWQPAAALAQREQCA